MTEKLASAQRSTALIKLNEREREALREASAADGIGRTRWCKQAVRTALEQRGYLLVQLSPAREVLLPEPEPGILGSAQEALDRAMEAGDESCDPITVDLRVPDVEAVERNGTFSSLVTVRDGTRRFCYEVGMSARDVRARLGIKEPATMDRSGDAPNPLRELHGSS